MNTEKKRLGDILIDCNLISLDQLKSALAHQKEKGLKLGEALTEMGLVTEDDIIWALGNQLNISFIHLNPDIVNREVLKLISAEFAREHHLIPLYQAGNQLSICMVDPLDSEAIDYITAKTGMNVSISICTMFDFEQTFSVIYGPLEVDSKVESEITPSSDKSVERGIPKGMEGPEKVINYILGQAIINKVDRIHFEPSENGVLIRFRICSTLVRKVEIPLKIHHEVIAKLKNLSQIGREIPNRALLIGHFRVTVSGRMVNIQSTFYPTVDGEMAILKLTDFGNVGGLIGKSSREVLEEAARSVREHHGILFVTGPRESGRTTTNYFIMNAFEIEKTKIVTVEDPVYCSLPKLTQIQVGQNGVETFKHGIDIALLLDPDIIYIDHLEGSPIIEDIVFAALGGRTILTSFTAYDAPGSIVKLLEWVKDPVILARSIGGVLAQRLIRTLCPNCKKTAPIPEKLLERMAEPPENPTFFAPVGCEGCQFTGYIGRTLVTEYIPNSPTLRQMIINRQNYQEFHLFARKQGILTLEEKALSLVFQGETSVDEFNRLF